ncbi:hypothetical protein CONCODRAFT_67827 [Conidiobolus coronatus NRRL 28638]|uniref:Uncharacterized protein n=1 Tax=Conidiobolus coronatus (strain ATCC 28846 / CBS 209.66 / NRRL 28638) TaxID=796925 RepID=A0A137PGC5_CONC2|nr:hypothetical protein CONCODRAFT_67827 [Conidiobolus coronatus NRRL 28638]|eukprot:KXN74057.1 hypothetical protein CONCODRAFT_67827 [Conidiobolus coronatus NRRL 28638]
MTAIPDSSSLKKLKLAELHDDLGDLDPKLESEAKKSDAVAADSKSKDPTPSDSKAASTGETSEQADTNQTSEPKKAIRTLGTVQVSLSETKTDVADPDKLKEQLAIEEEKRKLRAQRFGAAEPVKRKSPTKSNSENPKKISKPDQPSTTLKVNEDPELLKKRQEKFGVKSAPITAPKESKIISLSLSNTSKDSTQ